MTLNRDALRRAFLEARGRLTEAERAAASERVLSRLVQLRAYQNARTVLIYRAVGSELPLQALPGLPASAGKRFTYPVCLPERQLAAMLPTAWRTGAFGIPEPDPAVSLPVPPEELDLILCPGVAFDARRTRLGMGGGYYDRFLPRCRKAVILMAAFEVQRAETLPAEPWDVPMDGIVTESCVFPTLA